jgi:hypothetical protein
VNYCIIGSTWINFDDVEATWLCEGEEATWLQCVSAQQR